MTRREATWAALGGLGATLIAAGMVYAFLLLEDGSSPCGRFVGPIELPSPCAWIDRDPDPRPVWLPPIRFEDGQRELVGLDVWCVGAGCAPDLSQFGDDDGDEKAKP